MKIIEKIGLAILVISFLGFIAPGLEAAQKPTVKVDCSKGESVQSALDSLTGVATIDVTGTCHEYLTIEKDDVSIQGGEYLPPPNPGGTIMVVLSARRVSITGVTVTGGYHGITVYQGGSLTLDNSTISEATSHGVVVYIGSSLIVHNNCEIRDNGQVGVFVSDNSSLALTYSKITNNRNAGVLVQRSSSARIGVDTLGIPGPNEITNNGGAGVNVTRSSHALIDGNTITGNSGHGVNIEGASATVTNNAIENNRKGVIVHNSGSARIGITEGDQRGPNTIANNFYEGIEISNSAAAYMLANTIQSNGLTNYRPGVAVSRASGRLIGENTIQGNGGHGVAVNLGALFQGVGDFNNITPPPGPDLITENGYSGISGWNGASLDIRRAEVTNNVQNGIVLSLRSSLRIYDSTVSGHLNPDYHGIAVNQGSGAILSRSGYPPVSVTGNSGYGVFCGDSESSCAGDTSGVNGNGPKGKNNVNCTGF
jgi:parallel beta-helix repeat protein